MSEAELHILRARLDGGIRNKAARGELRRGLPVGFVWGEGDGEVRFQPDEAVTGAILTVFSKFTELGSVRKVWLWFRSEGLSFPLRATMDSPIRWVAATDAAILKERAHSLDTEIAHRTAGLEAGSGQVPRINLIASEYLLEMLKAERAWTSGLEKQIREGKFTWNLKGYCGMQRPAVKRPAK